MKNINLNGKHIALTGATGGIGRELCKYFISYGASLILLDRNRAKSQALGKELLSDFPEAKISYITTDLEDLSSVKRACDELSLQKIDYFIHNAGAYSIPRHKCSAGFDNVFMINFVSPYYMIRKLVPIISTKVIVVGSIAHNYSKSDINDIDFSSRTAASKVYGNAKRYLMFSLYEYFKNEKRVKFAVAHPGITFTNITAHYPKIIFALIKHPMKIIFMKPKYAALSIVQAVFDDCGYHEWIGPKFFNIWGKPKKKKLKTCSVEESIQIGKTADEIYQKAEKTNV